MTFSFPVKIQSRFVKYESISRCYETLDTEGNKQKFYSEEGLIEFLAEQGYWYSGPVGYNTILFQRFESKLVNFPVTI